MTTIFHWQHIITYRDRLENSLLQRLWMQLISIHGRDGTGSRSWSGTNGFMYENGYRDSAWMKWHQERRGIQIGAVGIVISPDTCIYITGTRPRGRGVHRQIWTSAYHRDLVGTGYLGEIIGEARLLAVRIIHGPDRRTEKDFWTF